MIERVDKKHIEQLIKGHLGDAYISCLIIDIPESASVDVFIKTTAAGDSYYEDDEAEVVREYLRELGYTRVCLTSSDKMIKREVER